MTIQKSTIAAIAFSILAAATLSSDAEARWTLSGCFAGPIKGATGVSPSIKNAKRNARIKWRTAVRKIPGHNSNATKWEHAIERTYSCRKKTGTHRCNAIAKPCLGYEVQ